MGFVLFFLGLKAALGTFTDSSTGVNGGQGAYFALAMIESAIGKCGIPSPTVDFHSLH
jgi:hypothetical protein